MTSVNTTVGSTNALIVDISDDVETLASASARITSDAAQIAEGIRKGEGTVGKLLKDDELYTAGHHDREDRRDHRRRYPESGAAGEASDRRAASRRRAGTGVTARSQRDACEARTAMAGLSDNMEALKRGFFFRGFFNRRGYFSLDDISPEEYRQGELTKDRNRRASQSGCATTLCSCPRARKAPSS